MSRGPMPSVVAPGRRRPITRSHAEIGWRRIDVSPLISGSCWSGNPQIRRIAAQRFAEESRRRHADDRERVALDDERARR